MYICKYKILFFFFLNRTNIRISLSPPSAPRLPLCTFLSSPCSENWNFSISFSLIRNVQSNLLLALKSQEFLPLHLARLPCAVSHCGLSWPGGSVLPLILAASSLSKFLGLGLPSLPPAMSPDPFPPPWGHKSGGDRSLYKPLWGLTRAALSVLSCISLLARSPPSRFCFKISIVLKKIKKKLRAQKLPTRKGEKRSPAVLDSAFPSPRALVERHLY